MEHCELEFAEEGEVYVPEMASSQKSLSSALRSRIAVNWSVANLMCALIAYSNYGTSLLGHSAAIWIVGLIIAPFIISIILGIIYSITSSKLILDHGVFIMTFGVAFYSYSLIGAFL